ncbi:MAG: nucleotidyltransferase family protein [Rhodospirillales bacterium]|nr:nucleotidyltransferase family protein [Rhodospirillales bacterium]
MAEAGRHSLRAAMLLAAGLGLRMRPITEKTPKPLVQVAGRTLIDMCLDRVAASGIGKAVVNTHYLAGQVEAHLKRRPDLDIVISHEPELLGTGGGVANALPHLGDEPFLVVNTDSLWLDGPSPAIERLALNFDESMMDALLLMHSTVEAYGYEGAGDFVIDAGGLLSRRPEREQVPYAYTGVMVVHPRLLAGAPGGAFSFNLLYDRAIEAERLYGIVHDGEWFHVGTTDGLDQVEDYMSERFPGIRHR